ncbi:MAG: helix-turn-helix transcriptional regulator [bacterium]|nr:helix-turn-helix transcriptional regulator [bacterium]
MKARKSTIDDRDVTEGEIRKVIGKKIKEMRNKLGLSALRVADELHVSREAITHIETGRNNISAVALWKLAILFDCDVNDFFPTIPDGYALTKVDIHKVAQEDERAAEWAEKLFRKTS